MPADDGNPETQAWQAYRDGLFRFVLSRVSDAATAEDIVQDVLLKAYARQATLRDPSRLRAWLYQITRNTITDYYRARKPTQPLPEDLMQEDGSTDGRDVEQELADCLLPLLRELGAPYRQALELADFQGVKQREISETLGLSLSGTKSRVQRARRMLRDLLLECCHVEFDRSGRATDYEIDQGCNGC